MLLKFCEEKNIGWIIWASAYYFKCSALFSCMHSGFVGFCCYCLGEFFFDNASQALIKKIKALLLWPYLRIAKLICEKRKK